MTTYRTARVELNDQRAHWDETLAQQAEKFGVTSMPAEAAADVFLNADGRRLLELGASQGRDTFFFMQRGFVVEALDYAASAVAEIESKAVASGVSDRVSPHVHDVRGPLPFTDASFDACYSHMLFCMALTTTELDKLAAEVRRVLRPAVYTCAPSETPAIPTAGTVVTWPTSCTKWVVTLSTSSIRRRSLASPVPTRSWPLTSSRKERCRGDCIASRYAAFGRRHAARSHRDRQSQSHLSLSVAAGWRLTALTQPSNNQATI